MKTFNILTGLLIFTLITAKAQSNDLLSPSTGTNQAVVPVYRYQLAARDANQQTWQATTLITNANGQISRQIHKFVEIANGLNHWQNGQWVESREAVEIQPDGTAAATNGQHQAYFPIDLYEETIKLVTPDNYQLKSQPIGLGYDDGSNIVMIGTLTNSTGSLLGSNQVIYADAFSGIKADLLYTYRKGGFEQDVILRQQPPLPESMGLNPATTRLQVYTEFFDTPNPLVSTNVFQVQGGLSMSDQMLSFGSMKMVPGHAFLSGDSKVDNKKDTIVVGKQWLNWEGRQILVEEVPLAALTNDVASLPKLSMTGTENYQKLAVNHRRLPDRHLANAHGSSLKQRRLARIASSPQQGLVLDYNIVLTGITDFTFRGDTTYYVTSTEHWNMMLYGTTTFEGGAVIKFNPYVDYAGLELCGPIKCLTEPYRPAIFTVKDDDSVGSPIVGSTGCPFSATNYSTAIGYVYDGAAFNVHDLQVRYLRHGVIDGVIEKTAARTNIVSNCEFYSVLYPIIGDAKFIRSTNRLDVRNVLIQNAVVGFLSWNGQTINAVNITAHDVGYLFGQFSQGDGIFGEFTLTNSMVVNATNWGWTSGINQSLLCVNCGLIPNPNDSYGFWLNNSVNLVNCATNSNPDSVFQTAGSGAHYLVSDSPYRNAGTTNIDPGLMANLREKTTYAPIDYSNAIITTATILVPQVGVDTNSNLDLGYHYPPVDYVLANCLLTNTTLTITNGTIVAVCGNNGLRLLNGSQIISVGSPVLPNLIVRSAMVQELPDVNTNSISADSSATASGFFRFTKFSSPAESGFTFYHALGSVFASLDVQNCEFWGGANDVSGSTNTSTATFNNNLFWRSSLYASNISAQAEFHLTNNSFFGTAVTLKQPAGGVWSAFNNNFNSSSIVGTLTNGYNAYLNSSGRLFPTNSHDVVSSTATNYQSGPLGDFYLPAGSPLINAGNTNASLLGLYQFTTQTNQGKDANSLVDIGYHYVALNTNGVPMASSGDGIADYIEDPNGFTNWLSPPSIFTQPSSQSAIIGNDIYFTVTAGGFPALSYQWYFNGSAITGATNATLEIDNVQTNNIGSYYVTIANALGSVTSLTATLSSVGAAYGYMVLNGALTNIIFQGDTTYYVNSSISLYGTTVIEGGTVIKFSNKATSQLILNGPLQCRTSAYHPALLTSKDETSVGAYISQTTGIPATNYVATYLVGGVGQTNAYRNLHIKYAKTGILGTNSLDIWDCQFIRCGTAIGNNAGANIALHNVLVTCVTNCVSTTGAVCAEFLTLDQCQAFSATGYTGANVTNSLLTAVANTNGVNLISSFSLGSGLGIFQQIGGGSHYLTNTAYQSIGNINISMAARADIAMKTTRPPIVYYSPNVYFSSNLDLYPQAIRDNQANPDIGYHYDPLDYIIGSIYVTNASIVFNAGTAIGLYQTNSNYGYGISLANNSSLMSKGRADNLVHILYYNDVQEEHFSGWERPWFANICEFSGTNYQFSFSFTDWSSFAQDCNHFTMYGEGPVNFQNCQFHGGQLTSWNPTFNFINCLFDRVNCDIEPGDNNVPVFRNNTVFGGTYFGYYPWNTDYAVVKDNLFDHANIDSWFGADSLTFDGGHNAYVSGCPMLAASYSTDVILSNSPIYQTGPLGNYYLPTNSPLINAGSTNAGLVGLYHYTTQTNQMKETNSLVDIGYHYAAMDGSGFPVDSDGDGVFDYLEDGNGDGVYGTNDLSDWQDFHNGMPVQLLIMGGNYQCGPPGSLLPQALVVKMTDTNNVAWTNASLIFTATQGGLMASTNGTTTNSIVLRTDINGLATVYFALPLTTNADCYVDVTALSGTNSMIVSFKEHTLVPAISAGYYHALYLKPNGHVLAWGWEAVGGVTGTTDRRVDETNIPVEIPGLTNIVRISTGEENAMAVGIDGTVWEWGWVPSANSGYPYGVYQITPRMVDGLTNVVDIASTWIGNSRGASIAIESDGTVWEWGGIFYLGPHYLVPTQIAGITNAVQIAAGDSHVLVLLQNGQVVAFGDNWSGQVGDGTYNDALTPVAVTNLVNIVQIAAGYGHSLAIDTNGVVWTWGDNYKGELGIGVSGKSDNFWDTNLPVQVAGISNIVQIAGGDESSMAVDNIGNVWQWGQWGYNWNSQYTGRPFQVTNLTQVARVSAGGWNEFFYALMPDGRVLSWGGQDGADFPLGYGVTDTSNVPDNSEPYSIYFNPVEPKLQIIQGNFQAGFIDTNLPQSLIIRVTDQSGNPLTNAPVYVRVDQGDLLLGTNADGDTYSDWLLDTDASGEVELFAYAYDFANTNCLIKFYAAAPAGGLGVETNFQEVITRPQIGITGGSVQMSASGSFLPIIVHLTDLSSMPLTNVPVTMTVISGVVQIGTTTNGIWGSNLDLYSDASGIVSAWAYMPTNADQFENIISIRVWSNEEKFTEAFFYPISPKKLSYWRFNTTDWLGEGGQPPLTFANLVSVPDWSTNAVVVDSILPSYLAYRDVETNGYPNFMPWNGTVRFWFKPDWQSGIGPGSQARLIEMGEKDSGDWVWVDWNYQWKEHGRWWGLIISPDGTGLSLITQANEFTETNLNTAVNWTPDDWHQVTLTFGPTNSTLYLDGRVVVTNGLGVNLWPDASIRANGFFIGSDNQGNNQAQGQFDELETFNYAISASDVASNYLSAALSAPVISLAPANDGVACLLTIQQTQAAGIVSTVDWTTYPNSFGYLITSNYADAFLAYGDPAPSQSVGINITKLPPPVITPASGYFNSVSNIVLSLSPENLTNLVAGLYLTELGRLGSPGEISDLVDYAAGLRGSGNTDEQIRTNLINSAYFRNSLEYIDEFGAPGDMYLANTNIVMEYSLNGGTTWYIYATPILATNSITLLARVVEPGSSDHRTHYAYLNSDTVAASFEYIPASWLVGYFGSGYGTNSTAAPGADSDHDGLSNLQEYQAGTDPTMVDTDGDGINDGDEVLAGTDPLDAGSIPNQRLGYWRFDTTSWLGEAGQDPLSFTNLASVPDWSNYGLSVSTNIPAQLAYRVVETNGNANINYRYGTVRFWFKADWNSSTTNSGTGPGSQARLLEIGSQASTNGWWALVLSADGTELSFITQTNGSGMTNLTTTINWASNDWHQLALTYSATNISLYLDGQAAITNGTGISHWPNAAALTSGFFIGSDNAGNHQAGGVFDELETFDYPLSGNLILIDYTTINPSGAGPVDYVGYLEGRNPAVHGASAPDTNGIVNLQIYTPLH